MKCGIVDVEPNTIRLSIYHWAGGRFKLLLNKKEMAGLAGYIRDGVLSDAGILLTCRILSGFRALLDNFDISDMYVFGTAALRNIVNTEQAVDTIREVTGIRVEVLTGAEEAALSFSGASAGGGVSAGLLADIGGGSTEMVVGRAGQAPAWAHSFDIGCRRVTEKFIRTDPPASDELDRAREWVSQQLARRLGEAGKAGITPERLVAAAGTATTVVAVRDQMRVYDSTKVHKALVTRQQLDRQYAELAAMPLEQRSQVVGLDPGRAPVIVAGLVIMQAVMDAVGVDGFTVSETDILHGIILDAAKLG